VSKKRGHRVSFAVSDYDDGGVRATSPTTLIKTSREDIYIGAQLGMGTFKISLHGGTHGRSEAWQMGYTSEHRDSGAEPLWGGRSRLTHTWTPTPFIDGVRTALIWDTYRGALCARSFDPEAIQLKFPENGGYVRLIVGVTDAGMDPRGCEGQVSHPLPLASGRLVWLAWQSVIENVPDEVDPAQVAIMSPGVIDVDGIDVPRITLRGGDLDLDSFRSHQPSCPWPAPQPTHLSTGPRTCS